MSQINRIITAVRRFTVRNKYHSMNRDKNIWVFGEWFGDKCNDNCMYFANYVAEHYKKPTLYWVVKPNTDTSLLSQSVRRIEMGSTEALSIYSRAGAVFVNEGLKDLSEDGFNYFSGAVIVNLWHGVPWKKIGMDSYSSNEFLKRQYAKLIYKLQEFTCFPASSQINGDRLQSAFMINSQSGLIKAGLPRNAFFYNNDMVASARKRIEEVIGQRIDSSSSSFERIIVYMPTFRDKNMTQFSFSSMENENTLSELLDRYNAIIVQKAHIVTQQRGMQLNQSITRQKILTINDISAQELMAAADILITDYSSCFFDYLILDRPIIHYVYDYDYYDKQDRGLYYSISEVACGDTPRNEDELIRSIESYLEDTQRDKELRSRRRDKYIQYDAENNNEIILNHIISLLK